MKYIISGTPIPLQRPRFYNGVVYDSQKAEKRVIAWQLKAFHSVHPLLVGPLKLEANFFMPIPKSWPKKRKDSSQGQPHISTPDWSNLLKFIEDCANGICYEDDSHISSVSGMKVYDSNPRTELTLTTLTPAEVRVMIDKKTKEECDRFCRCEDCL